MTTDDVIGILCYGGIGEQVKAKLVADVEALLAKGDRFAAAMLLINAAVEHDSDSPDA